MAENLVPFLPCLWAHGFLLLGRYSYLMHDQDTKFTEAFDQYLRDNGVEPVVLPPQSPNLNAPCDRLIISTIQAV